MPETVLKQFGLDPAACMISQYGNGLINTTWLVETKKENFILQLINRIIFKQPEMISYNTELIGDYLKEKFPDYLFVRPYRSIDGNYFVKELENHFRFFSFVHGSHSIDIVESPGQAFEAARQFGKFSKLLAGFNASDLKLPLTDFHNLKLRYNQFETALKKGNVSRIKESKHLIGFLKQQEHILEEFESVKAKFKIRCTHHDTKISNVLFDQDNKGLCVIDLDTVMPGYFISDLGDMMRTYLPAVNEEEKDYAKISIRKDIYEAILDGYLSEMGEELNATEKKYFQFAGFFMIYMQAIRFLTDHINDDIYYGAKYAGHNFIRAGNQVTLLQKLMEFNPG